ncbi:hypothetical protein CTI12_AA352410 [Artemisia annua]|uniref:PI4-kinase N-terminal domain-containing protein n=1 Tax=Artemisia annua TaxID=35608 RepID=A0A2U1MQI1_ARTAN|nr:hypothetical protein CTI12_AA352410 [Artemisia annua]
MTSVLFVGGQVGHLAAACEAKTKRKEGEFDEKGDADIVPKKPNQDFARQKNMMHKFVGADITHPCSLIDGISKIVVTRGGHLLRVLFIWFKPLVLTTCAQVYIHPWIKARSHQHFQLIWWMCYLSAIVCRPLLNHLGSGSQLMGREAASPGGNGTPSFDNTTASPLPNANSQRYWPQRVGFVCKPTTWCTVMLTCRPMAVLEDGKEVAVKQDAEKSLQGFDELKNDLMSIGYRQASISHPEVYLSLFTPDKRWRTIGIAILNEAIQGYIELDAFMSARLAKSPFTVTINTVVVYFKHVDSAIKDINISGSGKMGMSGGLANGTNKYVRGRRFSYHDGCTESIAFVNYMCINIFSDVASTNFSSLSMMPAVGSVTTDLHNLVQKVKMHLKLSSFELGDLLSTEVIGMQMELPNKGESTKWILLHERQSNKILKSQYERLLKRLVVLFLLIVGATNYLSVHCSGVDVYTDLAGAVGTLCGLIPGEANEA